METVLLAAITGDLSDQSFRLKALLRDKQILTDYLVDYSTRDKSLKYNWTLYIERANDTIELSLDNSGVIDIIKSKLKDVDLSIQDMLANIKNLTERICDGNRS